jgi:hypothetical protein
MHAAPELKSMSIIALSSLDMDGGISYIWYSMEKASLLGTR